MENPTPAFQQQLNALRSAYAQQLPRKARHIQDAWHALDKARPDAEGLNTLLRLLHNLAGSGASYGFPAVSAAAREIENDLREQLQQLHNQVAVHQANALGTAEELGKAQQEIAALRQQLVRAVAELAQIAPDYADGYFAPEGEARPRRPALGKSQAPILKSEEQHLLRCVVTNPALAEELDEALLDPDLPESAALRSLAADLAGADGDTSLTLFGNRVTPNAHALARRFGVFDRFFVNAEVSLQGHRWSTAAYVTDYTEKTVSSAYADKRSDPEEKEHSEAEEPAGGFLWHLAQEKGISFRNFGEATKPETQPDGSIQYVPTVASLRPYTDPDYPGFDPRISDQRRADLWIARLAEWEHSGDMPALQFLWLPNDHTAGARPGLPTPHAFMADNDRALGRIVEALSKSRFWQDTAVFILEDDAQAGPDHVDSHRSVLLTVSPYNRPGTVHRFVNTTDVLATIEAILGLRALSHFDHFGRPLAGLFAAEPDLRPYTALEPSVPWTELNPPAGEGARASLELDLDEVDSGQDDLFNRALWQAVKGGAPYPGATRATLLDLERGK